MDTKTVNIDTLKATLAKSEEKYNKSAELVNEKKNDLSIAQAESYKLLQEVNKAQSEFLLACLSLRNQQMQQLQQENKELKDNVLDKNKTKTKTKLKAIKKSTKKDNIKKQPEPIDEEEEEEEEEESVMD